MSAPPRVLIVDDRQDTGADTRKALEDAGFYAVLVSQQWVGDFYDEIREKHFHDETWDVLVLDVNFHRDACGGIWLYNKLAHGHHLDCCGHTVIYTKYAGADIRGAKDGERLWLKIFADTAGIPFENILPNTTSKRQNLITRIKELLGLPP